MEQIRNENPLGYEKVPVLLRKFATPSIVAMLVSSLYNVIDQVFIGQGVGFLGNGATNVAFPFTTICLAIALLIGIGSASSYSLYLGEGHKDKAEKCVGNAVWMMLVLGIIYAVIAEVFLEPMLLAFGATEKIMPFAVDYVRIIAIGMPFLIFTNATCNLIRADGSPKYSMICMVTGAIINTVLDPLFIFPLNMGMKGAALATVISQVVSAGMALAYFWKFKHVELKRSSFEVSFGECAKQATYGLSNSLNQLGLLVVQIVMNQSLAYYGAKSIYGPDIPLSACGIVFKVNSLFMAVYIGLSQGSQPIVGFNYGAKQYKRVRQTYKDAILVSLVVSSIALICFQGFPRQIIACFGDGTDLYFKFAVKFMRVFLLMMPAIGVHLISSNFFSAVGKPIRGVILSLSRQLVFLIPLLFIFPRFWGVEGIMYTAPIADGLACILAMIMIWAEFTAMKKKEQETVAES